MGCRDSTKWNRISDKMGWQNEKSLLWEIRESEPRRFELWSSQTNDLKIDTCCYLAWCLALLG